MKSLLNLLLLGLVPLHAVFAQDAPLDVDSIDEDIEDPATTPRLQVSISASFPQAEVFGVKLVNNHPTEAVLSVTNNEPAPITLRFVGGSLSMPAMGGQPARAVRNLTSTVYNTEVPEGASESFNYKFTTELHPADLLLQLAAIIADSAGNFYTVSVFNETVSVVEAPTSIFDPQIIFLYLILAGAFAGTSYFIYNTWITTLFPQQKRRATGKGGDRVKTSSRSAKKVETVEQTPAVGEDGPAVATAVSKGYDESWIPAQHLQRPQAKRIRSGTPSGVKSKPRAA